jgi:hypothetical protein
MKVLMLSPTPIWPNTFGNRVRIARVVQALRETGCRVDFAYYAAEHDWRESVPEGALSAMGAVVENFYLIPTQDNLHQPSRGTDHLIDEWWDDRIGQFLHWIFKRERYDIFYVNYTWLSKAFEYAPSHTLKVLDTHDRFSGRREVLQTLGIDAEFFHLTEAEEAKGHNRAELVLAIKSLEEKQFRLNSTSHVMTLIHASNTEQRERKRTADEPVKFGIFGAKNNINKTNIVDFLDQTRDQIFGSLLPVEISIFGSICELLRSCVDLSRYPWVRLYGYVEQQRDFYNAVDYVLIPIASSTGLKIKAAEALSYQIPIIAHKHGFEGLPYSHAFHRCSSFPEMGEAICSLAYESEVSRQLERASRLSQRIALKSFDSSIEHLLSFRYRVLLDRKLIIFRIPLQAPNWLIDHVLDLAKLANCKVHYTLIIISESTGASLAQLLNGCDFKAHLMTEAEFASFARVTHDRKIETLITNDPAIAVGQLCPRLLVIDDVCHSVTRWHVESEVSDVLVVKEAGDFSFGSLNCERENLEVCNLPALFWKHHSEQRMDEYVETVVAKLQLDLLTSKVKSDFLTNDSGWAALWGRL